MLSNPATAKPQEVQDEILRELMKMPNGSMQSSYNMAGKVFGSQHNWHQTDRITRNLTVLKKKGYVVKGSWAGEYTITGKGSAYISGQDSEDENSEYRWVIRTIVLGTSTEKTSMDENWEPFTASGKTIYFRKLVEK